MKLHHIDRRRVGVLGIQRSGKSTFLTSLINHFRAHDVAEFPLGDGSVQIAFNGSVDNDNDVPPFPYDHFREQLADVRWPGKTTSMSQYRCRLKFSGGSLKQRMASALSETDLTLIDIPGERLADLSMAGRSYAEWSDQLLSVYEEKNTYWQACRDYFELLEENTAIDETTLVNEYRRALAKLVVAEQPLISPSTMRVTPDGQYVPKDIRRRGDAEALAALRFVGLDEGRQFVPLPSSVRAAHPELTEQFSDRYDAYVTSIVRPLWNEFHACDRLLLLIDPTVLLAGGVDMYNNCLHMLRVALEKLAPGRKRSIWDRVIKAITVGWLDLAKLAQQGLVSPVPRVSKVGIVLSQIDKVHRDDREALGELISAMTAPLIESRRELQFAQFACSAVNSSASHDYPKLEVLMLDERERPEVEPRMIEVTPVPKRWPARWKRDDFFYPSFAPVPPSRADYPPTHIGLHRVADFVFDL
jgi:predicted YcjX-like family ATPase